jgi:Holliday junction resolvase
MNKSITLNREQIEKLYEIAKHFKEINHFNIKTDSSSGIGVGVVVSFDLFQKNDTMVDITDVKEW